MLAIGAIVTTFLAVYLRPQDFPLNRREVLTVALLLTIFGLVGARILFILIHRGAANNGFAYFGALVFFILTLSGYSILRKVNLLELLDYAMPFLILSQFFVRIGCLMAGCCYGKPTNKFFGVVFKTVDGLSRHPTQAYEAVALFSIYIVGRIIYNRYAEIRGLTMAGTLALYGLARFFIEYLRTDSPSVLFNLSLAQVSCLSILMIGAGCGGLFIWKR
ncbi:MAG: prolipoprotein diacylglyceryl transferase [Candidatus Omnitrophica bacterium]|nr:prolipoprotein diacylglyceryl transferase [Candidatus Omnitrophota bacterium]